MEVFSLNEPPLGTSSLGASTFCATTYSSDSCGSNGLPLTPASVKILGNSQSLRRIRHENLCHFVDLIRGKHERVFIISEHYPWSLKDHLNHPGLDPLRVCREIASGLNHLHENRIAHRNLALENILVTPGGRIKLSAYGIFHMTDSGTLVLFPTGHPFYLSPEVLLIGSNTSTCNPSSQTAAISVVAELHFKSDVWSLALISLQLFLKQVFLENGAVAERHPPEVFRDWIQELLTTLKILGKDGNFFEYVVDKFGLDGTSLLTEFPCVGELIRSSLAFRPSVRPSVADWLKKLNTHHGSDLSSEHPLVQEDSLPVLESYPACPQQESPLAGRPLSEVFYLWLLTGGDVEAELTKEGLVRQKPPIFTVPRVVILEGEMFGQHRDETRLYNPLVVTLPLQSLIKRLEHIPREDFFPLTEEELWPARSFPQSMSCGDLLKESQSLPLLIREKDVDYQVHRCILFRKLLNGYPYKRPGIFREARTDISPLYRPYIWAALLDVHGDLERNYTELDKDTPTATDRQIEVDIPRCHQYQDLLASPEGHRKFKRILKAWVVSHPQYVYWQGLDSLAAPFIFLNFNQEPLAFACFKAFIDKYLHNFFLKDNALVIQEYLAVFSHLVAFHDPFLRCHLDEIGFHPELYAIPWFLTMYTHVFPLQKIFHLWDTLLLGNSSYPLLIGVAILQQLRDSLLKFGFNECILLFSDLPEIDIERCLQDSIRLFCATPKTVMFRSQDATTNHNNLKSYSLRSRHELNELLIPPSQQRRQSAEKAVEEKSLCLAMTPRTLEELKSEIAPRISVKELLELQRSGSFVVLDVRSPDEYQRGTFSGALNMPYPTSFTPDQQSLVQSPQADALMAAHRSGKKIFVILSSKNGGDAGRFAEVLVHLGFHRVCILHGGIETLRTSGVLVVPS